MKAKLFYVTILAASIVLVTIRYSANQVYFAPRTNILKDLDCSVHFAPPNTLPPVALISAPGSGNTWLRHLLEQATGIYTGSVFQDPELYESGFLGEYDAWDSGRTIVVKTHTKNYHQLKRYPAAILLMRNAFAAVITECNRMLTEQRHLELVKWNEETVTSPEFEKVFNDTVDWWEDVAVTWLESFTRPLMVVHYEDLVTDPNAQLKKIIEFLNMTVSDDRLECVHRNKEGAFHKARTIEDRKEELTALSGSRAVDLRRRMDRVSSLLVKKGHKPLQTHTIVTS